MEYVEFRGWTHCEHCEKHTNKVFIADNYDNIKKLHNFSGVGKIQLCSKCKRSINEHRRAE